MISLYEIDKRLESLVNTEESEYYIRQADEKVIDKETGELLNFTKLIDDLLMERNEKIENVALWVKQLDAEVKALKEEEKSLAERRKSKESKAKSLENYIVFALTNNNQTKFETPKVALSFRRSESVEIVNEKILNAEFKKEVVEIKVDKTAIKQAIKSGQIVEGAELVEKQNLQIK